MSTARLYLRRKQSARSLGPAQRGSALLFVLFACLIVAVVIQTLTVVILCADGARVDEQTGRIRLREKDFTLAALRQLLLADWQPIPATWWLAEEAEGADTQGDAVRVSGSEEWLMQATVRHDPQVSLSVVSATAQLGRDGIDLPHAALVAGSLTADANRELAWVATETDAEVVGAEAAGDAAAAACYVREPMVEPILGSGCLLRELESTWRLDGGWSTLGSATGALSAGWESRLRSSFFGMSQFVGLSLPDVALGERAVWLDAGTGAIGARSRDMSSWDDLDTSSHSPLLVVVTGGIDLDARDLGDIYGVIVVDEGSVGLEGTVLHGAVFASDEVSLGSTGVLLYSGEILRWATDRSLRRVRLTPGTRWEEME